MVAVAATSPSLLTCFSMADEAKETLRGALRQLLRPLVRILLRHGVSFVETSETLKAVFVEVAERDFPLSSTAPVQSRVALLTGLTETAVRQVSEDLKTNSSPSTANLNRIGRLLAGWHQDPEFTGPYGLPLELPFSASGQSFEQLVQRYSDDAPARAMLDELQRVGAVTVLPGDRIRVLTRSYLPAETDPAILQFMGVALRDLAETLDFNLNPDIEGGYFERRVWTPAGIDPKEMPHFDALVETKGQEFLEMLDNWLTSRETEAEAAEITNKIRVGVGMYLFSDANRTFRED